MDLLAPASASPDFKWNEKAARHLLNRAGFGGPPGAVGRLAAMKFDEAVAAFTEYERYPDKAAKPDWLPEPTDPREFRRQATGMTEEQRRAVRNQKQRESREAMNRLQMWWIDQMAHTDRPLQEKMTLFWHGHFATSAEKVREPAINFALNEALRRNATGSFRTLLTEVGKSPAMLRYLDNMQSTKAKPNENWARELMELFTLGIGNYTERDIKEAARAFTGWTARGADFFFNRRQHDEGQKTVLGRTGNLAGEDVLAVILDQPACAKHICRKLWTFFAYENPEPEVVDGLAATFRNANYQVKPVLRQMFSSRAFFSDKAVWTQIKSPAQLVVNLLVWLDVPLTDRPPIAQQSMRAMGQSLFYPPNVKGWDGGRAWINTNTLLVRCNFANYLVSGVIPNIRGGGAGGAGAAGAAARRREAGAGDDGAPMMMDAMRDDAPMMAADTDEPGRNAPAGQDAMGSDIPARTMVAAMRQRRAGALQTRAMERAPFRAREFFAKYDGMTAAGIVDALADHFIGNPLADGQRSKLVAAFGQAVRPGEPVPVARMAEEDLRATMQLLLSTAEYQLC